ncbi:DUF1992 domain-containing protein [Thermorudis peleae]|uniref:DnaJ family domain-containing protein n=1 Tax=Thermorudis peleae TaxID=1382356 RepID=UPI000691639E|nr:DUF1992 domain-containing protein [Thermorudis peleae]MBX6753416.1 DUF1992 domain-containing protein [Thermorudis peleae]
MWWYEKLVEDRIKQAQEEGAFRNLPGEGKPLPRDDEPQNEFWAAHRLLRKNGVLPDWLQLRKEIWEEKRIVWEAYDEYWEAAARLDPNDPGHAAILRRLERRFSELARLLNKKIDLHNLRCPSMEHELIRIPEDLIARERARRATHRGST